jgi:hypothetical protein
MPEAMLRPGVGLVFVVVSGFSATQARVALDVVVRLR